MDELLLKIESLEIDLSDARKKLELSNNCINTLEDKLNNIKPNNNYFLFVFIVLIISIFILKIKSN